MEQQDTLAEILRVEKELREQLDDEQARAAAWLAETRRRADAAHASALESLTAAGATGESASVRAARDEAGRLVAEARQAARLAGQMRPEDLQPLVRRHLAAILPGGAP
jgi:hypothetical protein